MILDVDPAVRVAVIVAGQDAGIVQVPETDIVGSHGKPGAVRFGDISRDLVTHPDQVAGAAKDTLSGINPVGDTDKLGRRQCQHHQTADAGKGTGIRIPE